MTRISSFTGGFSGYNTISRSFIVSDTGDAEYDGAVMVFAQTNAPVGWTKITSHNDTTLRVVSGTVSTGGTENFSTVFTTKPFTGSLAADAGAGPWTLSTPQIPSHSHTVPRTVGQLFGSAGSTYSLGIYSPLGVATGGAGGGASHNHTGVPVTLSLSGDLNFGIKYVDVILASF